jgi:hypothetical protein
LAIAPVASGWILARMEPVGEPSTICIVTGPLASVMAEFVVTCVPFIVIDFT